MENNNVTVEDWGWFIDTDTENVNINNSAKNTLEKVKVNVKSHHVQKINNIKYANIKDTDADTDIINEEESNITICLMSFITMFFIYIQLVKEIRKDI